MKNVEQEQIKICQKYGAEYEKLDFNLKLGISANFFSGQLPQNGMRILPSGYTNGWYLWAGKEMSDDDDFFKPMHGVHLLEKGVEMVKYLALPPGWRFLIAPGYEDVWYDERLLHT